MPERRFSESEIQAIFQRATEATPVEQPHASASSEGMTLVELQEIGREAGISPEQIARAAKSLDVVSQREPRRVFGLPMGVERTVELDRQLSEQEWERLVVLLRETFNARGRVASEGSLRQWTNGNLQALLEPTANGQRVRLRTFKGNAPPRMVVVVGMLGLALTGIAAAVMRGALGDTGMVAALATLGAMGATMIGTTIASLPRWARQRAEQMESIAERLEENS
ncbi:MAG TPA: hypothetical protein VIP11_06050 [Gemmatimonadaceae bacterium]